LKQVEGQLQQSKSQIEKISNSRIRRAIFRSNSQLKTSLKLNKKEDK